VNALAGVENPFVRYRERLASHARALATGWTDDEFVALVEELDAAVEAVDGHGFGVTPLTVEADLAVAVGVATLLVKDETGNVAGSHKARHLMGLLLHFAVDAVATDARLAISSCGNAALGAATVARAAQRPLDVFIPTWADPVVVARLHELDATIHVCERQPGEVGDPCYLRFREAVAAGAVPFAAQAVESPQTLDGGRTLGFELADAIGASPVHAVFVQVGGGALAAATGQGLIEALAAPPAVWVVQGEGCAPLDRALRTGTMAPWEDPQGAATGILDDITYDWQAVAQVMRATGGRSVVAREEEILLANRLARQQTSIPVDHTGSAGLAGLLHARRAGLIDSDIAVAVLFTGRDRRAP
jgi:threonine synthase